IEDDVFALVGSGMTGDLLPCTSDYHLMDVTAHQHLTMPICGRRRVVVAAVTHQRRRVNPCSLLFAGVVGSRWQRQQGPTVPQQPLADRLVMTAQPIVEAAPAAL